MKCERKCKEKILTIKTKSSYFNVVKQIANPSFRVKPTGALSDAVLVTYINLIYGIFFKS